MGCFNVACSVSNLSIGYGTEVVFIPLLPNHIERDGKHLINPSKSLIYSNCYYNPFSLPIKGKYNDYGGVENIEKDENVESIEKYFGMEIENFIEAIGEDRDINDSYGALFQAYAIHKELISSYSVPFDEHFLFELGYKETDKGYQFNEFPYFVSIEESTTKAMSEGKGFTIKDESGHVISKCDGYDSRKQLLNQFQKYTGYMINVKEEDQEKVKLLSKMSGMFIHREIYDELVNFNGGKIPKFNKEYDDFSQALQKEKEEKRNKLPGIKRIQEMIDATEDEQHKEMLKTILQMQLETPDNKLDYKFERMDFYRHFKEWDYFETLYLEPVKKGKLKEDFSNYRSFYWSFYSCNRFFFPNMNGEQHGNNEASKMLLEKSLEIVKREIENDDEE